MANAKTIDTNLVGKPKILLVGSGGSGKTSQILTLPGRTFVYGFDPSVLSTLRGHDIEYELFLPGQVNMAAQSLSKGKGDKPVTKSTAGDVYREWEKDWDNKMTSGYWNQVDNICFDSFTTFCDIVMDRILEINGRPGHFPQQDDWTAQIATVMNVVRTVASMNKLLFVTAHDEIKQDETTSRIMNVFLMTGKLRVKVPLVFSEVLHAECQSNAKEVKYIVQTRPDRLNPNVRTSIRGLDMYHDVTIKDWNRPQDSGLGKLLKDKLSYNPPKVTNGPGTVSVLPTTGA